MQTTVGETVKEKIALGESIGVVHAHAVSNETFMLTRHRVTLTLPDGLEIPEFLIQYVKSYESPYHSVIIGMDVISRGRFEVFTDENGATSFNFSYNKKDMLSGDLEWQTEVE